MATFETKTVEQIVNEMLINLFENGTITDGSVGSNFRLLLENFSQQIVDVYDQTIVLRDGSKIDTATDDFLDNIGQYVGVIRKEGVKASGEATFRRLQPTASTFTINSGTIVSTHPNIGTQRNFVVTTNTDFVNSIISETHTFNSGNWYYALDQRFFQTGSSNVEIRATVSAVPSTVLTYDTDYEVITNYEDLIIDDGATGTQSFIILEDCDTFDNWTKDAGSQADNHTQNTTDEYEGTGAINLGKSGVGGTDATWDITITSTNLTDRNAGVFLKIADLTTKNKISNIQLYFGSSGTDYFIRTISGTDLTVGGKLYPVVFSGGTGMSTLNSPNISSIDRLKITINTKNASDTIAVGNVIMDMWFAGVYELLRFGDAIHFLKDNTLPDEGTDFEVDYIPLSVEVPLEAEEIGTSSNVSSNKIIYKVTNLASINNVNNYSAFTGGTDLETDDDLRDRIKFASELQGKATFESIRQNILAVNGVVSVSGEDTPLLTKLDEPLIYNTSVTNYKLGFDIPYLNNDSAPTNIHISNALGSSADDYIYGTDYVLATSANGVFTGEIEWLGATEPANGQTVYVDYDYNWLGHVNFFVAGAGGILPSGIENDIDEAIENSRSAGIFVNWSSPVIVTQDVTATITVDSEFDPVTVKDNVKDALELFLNTLEAGKNIYLAELYQVIMDVDGVVNAVISTPVSDVTITASQVAKAGTIQTL